MAEEEKPVDTSVLINLVSQMERCDDRAHDAYRKLLNRFPLSVRVLQRYAMFLDEIHNNLIEAEEVRKKIKKIQDAGMSDEVAVVAQVGSDVKSVGGAVRSKKERQGYKEYRKQVYLYSKANSFLLNAMTRGVLFTFVVIAVFQLLAVNIGIGMIQSDFNWIQNSENCRGAFPTLHTLLRTLQSSTGPTTTSFLTSLNLINNTLTSLAENSTILFDKLAARRTTYTMWSSRRVIQDMFHGELIVPNRSVLLAPLRDTTLLYLRHARSSIEAIRLASSESAMAAIFGSSAWRFLLDNGLFNIANAFGELTGVLAEDIRYSIRLVAYLEIAFCVYMPMINKAKRERETSLRAFLQIPKAVTQVLFRKYHEPGAVSLEKLNTTGEDSAQDGKSDVEKDTDDEGPGGVGPSPSSDVDVLHTKAMSGYLRLTLMYTRALLLIGASFSVALALNFTNSRGALGWPGVITSGMSVQHRALRVQTVVNDRFQSAYEGVFTPSLAPTIDLRNDERRWASSVDVIMSDLDQMERDQRSILYGNESLSISLEPLPGDYWEEFFSPYPFPPQPLARSLFERTSRFVDSAMRIAVTDSSNASIIMSDIRHIKEGTEAIVVGYKWFLDAFDEDAKNDLTHLNNVAIGMLVLVLVTILGTYFLYWRPILSYLIKTENERTLKLLLMIPVEIVADIDSLRDLLHLRQRTKIVNPPNPTLGPGHSAPAYRMDSEVNFNPIAQPIHQTYAHHKSGQHHPHITTHHWPEGQFLDHGEMDLNHRGYGVSIDDKDQFPTTVAEAMSMSVGSRRRSSMIPPSPGGMGPGGGRRSFQTTELKNRLPPSLTVTERVSGPTFEEEERVVKRGSSNSYD
ncbi:hypothetical protein HDU67_007032 [Dinochytrium kinnereticum]|nr:hypothetical protein HDU67_007032 [Dinochytrium kinnereticum]